MIARVWSGAVRTKDADAYAASMERTGVRDLAATPGNEGVYMLRRADGDRTIFTMVSMWTSLEAIRAFAGEDVERAVYYPLDEAYLLHRTASVTHYEVAASAVGTPLEAA